jgi:hypothetical protein
MLVTTSARFLAADDYPIGIPHEVAQAVLGQLDQVWGTEPWRNWRSPVAVATSGFAAGLPS